MANNFLRQVFIATPVNSANGDDFRGLLINLICALPAQSDRNVFFGALDETSRVCREIVEEFRNFAATVPILTVWEDTSNPVSQSQSVSSAERELRTLYFVVDRIHVKLQ